MPRIIFKVNKALPPCINLICTQFFNIENQFVTLKLHTFNSSAYGGGGRLPSLQ